MSDGPARPRVLMVEDEPAFTEVVSRFLGREGFEVVISETGEDCLARFDDVEPDVILLDLNLPGVDGMTVCRELRTRSDVPIIMLTAKREEIDKVLGLELGADDYVTKPFSPRELLARVRAVLRRSGSRVSATPATVVVGGFTIDSRRRRVIDESGGEVELTAREFDTVWHLVRRRGSVVARQELFESVWGSDYLGSSRTIDSHVYNIRAKLPGIPISTVRGVGYRLEED